MQRFLSATLFQRPILTSRFCGVLAVAALAGCGKEAPPAVMEMPPTSVTTIAAVAADVPVYLDEIGKTVALNEVSIVPQVGGKLTAVHVKDGEDVKKGQLLAEIDARPFEASLASAQAALAQSQASLALASLEYDRVATLQGTNAVSKQEFDQRKSNVAIAEAQVKSSEAAVMTASLDLEYTKIQSPIDGRAGAWLVDPGNVVKENEGSLIVVQSLDPIYAEFTINENDLGTVRKYIATRGLDMRDPEKGIKVQVDIPGDSAKITNALGTPTPATQPGKNTAGAREGMLVFLDNAVQSTTGTVKLRAQLPNMDRYFWPGQFVNVRLVLTTKKDAVLVPVRAQQISQQGPFVYIAREGEVEKPDKSKVKGMIAELRQIKPGQRQGDRMVVESGVKAGEQVIVTGQMMVQPGGLVAIAPPQVPQGAPASGQPATAPAATADAGAAPPQ